MTLDGAIGALDRVTREFTAVARQPMSREAMGEALAHQVGSWVPHDAMNLVCLNPCSGTISFGFWHRYPRELAHAIMTNCHFGDDPMRPVDLARRRVPVAMVRAACDRAAHGRYDVGDRAGRARRVLREHGAGCELRVLLRDGTYPWAVLCLFREEGRGPFTAEEADRVLGLSPALVAGLRAYVRAAELLPARPAPPPGVILLGADHTVRGVSAEADRWLSELRTAGASEWLSSAQWSATALASERTRGVSARPDQRPVVCVPAAHVGRWVTLHAHPLDPVPPWEPVAPDGRVAGPPPRTAAATAPGPTAPAGAASGETVVTVQTATAETLVPAFTAWYGLTPRERHIIEHFQRARTCRQVATALGISPHTVNDHLKAIFRKTGAHGRDELMIALGSV